jgi:cold shock protein
MSRGPPPEGHLLVRPAGARITEGVVKWFDTDKSYGFIAVKGHDRDIFCHQSQIIGLGWRRLLENQRVEFVLAEDGSRPYATYVSQPGNKPIDPPFGTFLCPFPVLSSFCVGSLHSVPFFFVCMWRR